MGRLLCSIKDTVLGGREEGQDGQSPREEEEENGEWGIAYSVSIWLGFFRISCDTGHLTMMLTMMRPVLIEVTPVTAYDMTSAACFNLETHLVQSSRKLAGLSLVRVLSRTEN